MLCIKRENRPLLCSVCCLFLSFCYSKIQSKKENNQQEPNTANEKSSYNKYTRNSNVTLKYQALYYFPDGYKWSMKENLQLIQSNWRIKIICNLIIWNNLFQSFWMEALQPGIAFHNLKQACSDKSGKAYQLLKRNMLARTKHPV